MKKIIILCLFIMFFCDSCGKSDSFQIVQIQTDAELNLRIDIPAVPETIAEIPPVSEPPTTAPPTTTAAPTTTTATTEPVTTTEAITAIITTEPIPAAAIATQTVFAPTELISKNVPVLMYHTSSEYNPGGLTELYVKPSEFEKQIRYLSDNGYTFCTFDDYYNLDNINKPVFITFDDGYRENYTEIFPILKKYNAKITLFLIIKSVTDSNLTKDMVVEMSDSGLVKFESHTNTHPSLVAISSYDSRLTDELQNSKIKIEEITNKKVLALSYPNGEFNEKVKEKTKEFYLFGVRKDLGMHRTEYDPYEVRRIRISRSTPLETFIRLVS